MNNKMLLKRLKQLEKELEPTNDNSHFFEAIAMDLTCITIDIKLLRRTSGRYSQEVNHEAFNQIRAKIAYYTGLIEDRQSNKIVKRISTKMAKGERVTDDVYCELLQLLEPNECWCYDQNDIKRKKENDNE